MNLLNKNYILNGDLIKNNIKSTLDWAFMNKKLILIGASTGGPGHLKKLFLGVNLPKNISVVIAQHMSQNYIGRFVAQFDHDVEAKVELVAKNEQLENKIYVCAKNSIISPTLPLSIIPCDTQITTFNPNINLLFDSAVKVCKFTETMAILLTGLGDDGAKGIDSLYKAGAKCVVESAESAVVFGMPKRAKELNPNLEVANLDQIRAKIIAFIAKVGDV